MELIKRLDNRRVVAPPRITAEERHGEAPAIPCERSNRARRRTGEPLGVIRKLDTATDEHTKRELFDFIGGPYSDSGGGMSADLLAKC